MSMKENAQIIAENVPKVYEAGQKAEYDCFWDNFQRNGNRTDYSFGFGGIGWTPENFKPKYPIRFNDANVNTRGSQGLFMCFGRGTQFTLDLSTIDIDFSGCKSMTQTFANANVNHIYIDGSNLESMHQTFNGADGGARYLVDLTLKVTEKLTSETNAFYYCKALKNLTFTEDSVIAFPITLADSNLLTTESVDSVIHALKDLTGETAKKIVLHTDVINRMSDEQVLQISNKNWQLG